MSCLAYKRGMTYHEVAQWLEGKIRVREEVHREARSDNKQHRPSTAQKGQQHYELAVVEAEPKSSGRSRDKGKGRDNQQQQRGRSPTDSTGSHRQDNRGGAPPRTNSNSSMDRSRGSGGKGPGGGTPPAQPAPVQAQASSSSSRGRRDDKRANVCRACQLAKKPADHDWRTCEFSRSTCGICQQNRLPFQHDWKTCEVAKTMRQWKDAARSRASSQPTENTPAAPARTA